jgi:glycosyltransferase involved in cell wall biosynthesis
MDCLRRWLSQGLDARPSPLAGADERVMNILEIVSGRGVNGAVVHSRMLAEELAARGHRVTLVCRPGAWIERELRGSAVDVILSDLDRWPTAELRRVAEVVEARAIDIVHTHMSRAHFFGVLLKWFSPVAVVATAHSRRMQPHWMCNDGVIAVSAAVARFQRRYNRVAARRLRVIHPFVDVTRFAPPEPGARQQLRETLGLAPQALAIGVVGSVFREKDLVTLVRALAAVRQSIPQACLVVVGDGPADYIAEVAAESDRLGQSAHVIWTGWRADVPEVMGALDLLTSTSVEEAFSLVAAEAMATGLPVVARRVGGIAELVVDGTTGVLVPADGHHDLVKAIVQLLGDRDRRREFGLAGRARSLECCSPETQVPMVEAMFAAVAAERR